MSYLNVKIYCHFNVIKLAIKLEFKKYNTCIEQSTYYMVHDIVLYVCVKKETCHSIK